MKMNIVMVEHEKVDIVMVEHEKKIMNFYIYIICIFIYFNNENYFSYLCNVMYLFNAYFLYTFPSKSNLYIKILK